MSVTRVTLDLYNSSIGFDIDGTAHVFTSKSNFISLTNFPFQDVNLITYELERNMFFVEYVGGVTLSGDHLPEIQWIASNLEVIKQAAITDIELSTPPPHPNRDFRNEKLYLTDWMVSRHQDQKTLGMPTTLSDNEMQSLVLYRQQLRDMPTEMLDSNDIQVAVWPTPPSFLA